MQPLLSRALTRGRERRRDAASEKHIHAAVLIANPRSGRTRRWLFPVLRAAERLGIAISAVQLDLSDESVVDTLETARRQGIGTIVVAGGDGTVGSVGRHLVGTDFALGVIPTGTSNDFARSLAIPMSVGGSIDVIAKGITSRVDAGTVNDRIFVHAAVAGINSQFASTAERLRSRLGRLSYPVACLEMYRTRRATRMTLTTADSVRDFLAYEIAFVNAPIYGGPLSLELAESNLLDHRLSVVVVRDLSPATLARSLPAAVLRHHLRLPGLDVFDVREARLETSPELTVTSDGEIVDRTPITIRVLPAALNVLVPRSFVQLHGRENL